jgi:hypothetical protein
MHTESLRFCLKSGQRNCCTIDLPSLYPLQIKQLVYLTRSVQQQVLWSNHYSVPYELDQLDLRLLHNSVISCGLPISVVGKTLFALDMSSIFIESLKNVI